jgi:hypothetical protein
MKQITGAGWLKDINDNFAAVAPQPATTYFVDTVNGSDLNNGQSFENAFATMSKALTTVETGGTIYFTGDVREELVGSNLKFDISIIGVAPLHHPDVPGTGYHPGASCWRPPASPTAATALIEVKARGWTFKNILFDCPVDAAAILLDNNSGSGLTEQDASHLTIEHCGFISGKYGIQLAGPIGNAIVRDCWFAILSVSGGCAIYAATDGGPHYRWQILDNFFVPAETAEGNKGNQAHIDVAFHAARIQGNVFGTVEATGKYIDLTGGQDNVVCNNIFGGVYDTDDYVAGTGDIWYQNAVAVVAVTAPDGLTLAAPAAP